LQIPHSRTYILFHATLSPEFKTASLSTYLSQVIRKSIIM
jgi:hypothetical protein